MAAQPPQPAPSQPPQPQPPAPQPGPETAPEPSAPPAIQPALQPAPPPAAQPAPPPPQPPPPAPRQPQAAQPLPPPAAPDPPPAAPRTVADVIDALLKYGRVHPWECSEARRAAARGADQQGVTQRAQVLQYNKLFSPEELQELSGAPEAWDVMAILVRFGLRQLRPGQQPLPPLPLAAQAALRKGWARVPSAAGGGALAAVAPPSLLADDFYHGISLGLGAASAQAAFFKALFAAALGDPSAFGPRQAEALLLEHIKRVRGPGGTGWAVQTLRCHVRALPCTG